MSNNIGNNIVVSGDSHASWASDLVWVSSVFSQQAQHPLTVPQLDHSNYSSSSGAGGLGAEFAGSAVSSPCPYGQNITLNSANNYSSWLVGANSELQWNDLYYRGYFELQIGYDAVNASFFGMPTIINRNPYEISIANFSVVSGENRIHRPSGGAVVESGAVKGGVVKQTNYTNDTTTSTLR